jgi:cobalt-zinc-cadmium efflux system outer membrane protein
MPHSLRLVAALALGLLASCATRRFDPAPLPPWSDPLPAATVLQSAPPLPGESLGAWTGLEPTDGAGALRVEQAVELALQRHPELAAVAYEVRAAQRRRTAAGRLPNPELEVEWRPTETGSETELGVEMDVTDVLLAPMRRRVGDAEVDVQRLRAQAAAVRLQFEARAAFYALSAGQQQLSLARQALETQAAARDLARTLLEAGNIAALDAVAQEAAYETLRQSTAGLELEVARRRERLGALLGTPVGAVSGLAGVSQDEAPPEDLEAQAVAASLELVAARTQLQGLGRATALAGAAGLWPEVSVGLLASREDQGLQWAGVGVTVGLPLFGQGLAARGALAAELDAADAREDQLVIDIIAAARTTAAQLAATRARASHQREVVLPLQRELTRQTLLQYNAMQVSPYELLAARRAELEAEIALVEADAAYWTAAAQRDALLSGLRVDAPLSSPDMATASAAPSGGH